MKKNIVVVGITLLTLIGCSSSEYKQRNLQLLAENRASLLSQSLPLQAGPLNILQATAQGKNIDMMMIYNTDGRNAKPAGEILQASIKTFCIDKSVRANLDVGLNYRIYIRNAQGQIIEDKLITSNSCQS